MVHKVCSHCRKNKSVKDFNFISGSNKRRSWCKQCEYLLAKKYRDSHRNYFKKYNKEYRNQHSDEIKKKNHLWYLKNRKEVNRLQKIRETTLRDKIYAHYGNVCVCCGETEKFFLTMDHIKGRGKKHRKEIQCGGLHFYRWIINHKFPKILQLMCYNCNCGRYRNGGQCPHRTSTSDK